MNRSPLIACFLAIELIDGASHSISLSNDSRNFAQGQKDLPQPQFQLPPWVTLARDVGLWSEIAGGVFLYRTDSLIGVPPNSRSPLAPPCNFKRQFFLGFNNYLRSALTLRGVGSRARVIATKIFATVRSTRFY
jgi:hypothetical protein